LRLTLSFRGQFCETGGSLPCEIGEALDLLDARRGAARQDAERIEVDGAGALRREVGLDEGEVGDFLGVVVDVMSASRSTLLAEGP
jgi:hypothetical protein